MNTSDAYRIEALLEIAAAHPEPLTAAVVARRRRIPGPFLGRLLAAMAKDGVVATTRGPRGGVRLQQPPELLALSTVLPPATHPDAGGRAVAWLADRLASARQAVLDTTSLADLAAVEQRDEGGDNWQI